MTLLVLMPSVYAEDAFIKQVTIGRDRAGMTWYLTDYGTNASGLYAIARKYYTDEAGKNATARLLSSRYLIPAHKTANVYFVEYMYEYTPDDILYAEVYRTYYDISGNEILHIEFDDSSAKTRKTFVNVKKNTIQSKGLAYATGRLKK